MTLYIDEKFEDYFDSLAIELEADYRFQEIKKELEITINEMLEADEFRTTGRAKISVREFGKNYSGCNFKEDFQLVVDFVNMTAEVKFYKSYRGFSRMI